MAVSAVILGAATVGSSVYSSRQMKKAASQPTPPVPVLEEPKEATTMEKERGRRGRAGTRSGTVTTSPSGVQTGQNYQGSTLLGG